MKIRRKHVTLEITGIMDGKLMLLAQFNDSKEILFSMYMDPYMVEKVRDFLNKWLEGDKNV